MLQTILAYFLNLEKLAELATYFLGFVMALIVAGLFLG